MPFDNQNLAEIPLGLFGGGCFEMSPENVPEGASPWLQDCEFFPGGVKQRRGLLAQLMGFTGDVNYVDTYFMPNGDVRTLYLDEGGNFYFEDVTNNPGVTVPIGVIENTGTDIYVDGFTQFGRKYLAFSDGIQGYDIPRQYDGTNFDRVSQDGPGGGMSAANAAVIYVIAASLGVVQFPALTSTSVIEAGNVVTIVFSANLPQDGSGNVLVSIGDEFTYAGDSVAGYNGTQTVIAVPAPNTLQFSLVATGLANSSGGTATFGVVAVRTNTASGFSPTPVLGAGFINGQPVTVAGVGVSGYDGQASVRGTFTYFVLPTTKIGVYIYSASYIGLANSVNGTITPGGTVSAGVHMVSVAFLTRQGYITRFSPPISVTMNGTSSMALTNIPTGPPNVVARIIAATAASGGFFFYIPIPTTGSVTGTQLNDNINTTAFIDFSDTTLLSSISVDTAGNNLFSNATLQPCLGVIGYSDRMVWWGERNAIQNFLNMDFDGGFIPSAPATPTGWTTDPINGAGGSSSLNAVWGFSYQISGDGATAILGMITQNAHADFRSVPILLPNINYSVRLSLLKTGAPAQGNAVVELFSPTLGTFGSFVVPVAMIGTSFSWQSGTIGTMPASIPGDLQLRIYTSGTLSAGASILFDEVTLYPTNQPVNTEQARVSYVINPETFDGVTGLIGLSEARGESIFSAFELREDLYFNTDGGKYGTADNGVTEPSGWSVSRVANSSGTTSVHGTISGENWEVTVGEKGAYMFSGGEPLKITQEISTSVTGIPPAWDQINWDFGFTIWGVNDIKRRILYFGVPMGSATRPNVVWMIDYKELQDASQIASSGPIHTSYSGKVISWEPGRKTSPWNMQINAACMIRRQDGTDHLWMGNGSGTGKVYEPVDGQYSDDGAAINSFYVTYMLPSQMISQQDPRLGLGRMLFTFLRLFIQGNGTLNIGLLPEQITNTGPTYTLPLSSSPNEDMETPVRVAGERCSFIIGTNAVGSWWSLGKMVVRLRRHPMSVLRHRN